MSLVSKERCYLISLNRFISTQSLWDLYFIHPTCFEPWLVEFRQVLFSKCFLNVFDVFGHLLFVCMNDYNYFHFIQNCLSTSLPDGYGLNVPRLNLLSSPEVRQPGKAPNYSVNWAKGYDNPEIIDAMKGKDQVKKYKLIFLLLDESN